MWQSLILKDPKKQIIVFKTRNCRVNPWTPVSDKREFLPQISIQYRADKCWEKKKLNITGLLVDPNSQK